MPLAENAACVAEINETVFQSAAALSSWIALQLYTEFISGSAAILRLAFPSKDENESSLKDHCFSKWIWLPHIISGLYLQNSGA